jgi:antitoxin VapB
MVVREERGKFEFEPIEERPDKIDLTGIYGAIPGLSRMIVEESERDWGDEAPGRD